MTPDQVTSRLAVAQLELMAKGHLPKDAASATRRALRYSRAMADRVRPALRDDVLEDLLVDELARCDRWLCGVEEARARGDYERGMARAVRDERYEAGMERLLGRPPATAEAWRSSVPAAVEAWETP